MLKEMIRLWKKQKNNSGTTLQRRLMLFFALVLVCVILGFTLLLIVFGITGSDRKTVYRYMDDELQYISEAVSDDFGELSVVGIQLSQTLSEYSDKFLQEKETTLLQVMADPELVQELLDRQMPALIAVAEHHACGGVFVVLEDRLVGGSTGVTERTLESDSVWEDMTQQEVTGQLNGLFIKKTQPVSSVSIHTKTYCLRGSANIARDYDIELMGQWKMYFERAEIASLARVMEVAAEHPTLSLSRLYYWTDRVCLNDNSEAGLMLCLPLRSGDGTIFGFCGIEISDRMFKQLYSPKEAQYQSVFSVTAPMSEGDIHGQRGLIAGNSYLTRSQMEETLYNTGTKQEFSYYISQEENYGGLVETLKIYPSGSPYADEEWAVAVLMPESLLTEAIRGNSSALFLIVALLLILGGIGCFFTSRYYLRPIKRVFSSIYAKEYLNGGEGFGLVEIDQLFEAVAQDIRDHREEIDRLVQEKKDALSEYERTQTEYEKARQEYERAQKEIDRLAYSRKKEVDPDNYQLFLDSLHTLTPTERMIFECYLDGMSAKEIMDHMGIKENTLKYHNKNIYSKLGVSSRKQLLRYAALMKQEEV